MHISLLTVLSALAAVAAGAKYAPVVTTEQGRISGAVIESVKGRPIYSFSGIPFALPPVGKLRFKDPHAPASWEGTRNGSITPPACLQFPVMSVATGMETIIGEEDCLYLNVFSPKIEGEELLPVMVFVHGGAFYTGSAEGYGPHVLLDSDVVLVVVQYRLGVLGFLSTEDSVIPGNFGLKDQTMALQWVQRNIHHFRGDKSRVTIFGESAGGASVHFQMLTPKAEGLFSRAILQSGSALCPWAINTKPKKDAIAVLGTLGCPTDRGSAVILGCLQQLDASSIAKHHVDSREWGMLPVSFVPCVDGDYLPAHPAELIREGRYSQVDIISGVTEDEGALFLLPALETPNLITELQNNFAVTGPASLQLGDKEVAHRMYNLYLGTPNPTEKHAEGILKMFSDRHFDISHDITTAYHTLLHPSKKTYRYELQHQGELSLTEILCPSCKQRWVCHADDLFYLFLWTPVTVISQPDDLKLQEIMRSLWFNFAATGNPTPDDSLGFMWEPSTVDNLHYLSLTPSPSMKPDNRIQERKMYSSLPLLENFILHPHLVDSGTSKQQDFKPHFLKNEL